MEVDLAETIENRSVLDAASLELGRGGRVMLIDDAHPGAGGYVVYAARSIDADGVNFLITHARGHVCIAMTESRMLALGVPLLARDSLLVREPVFGASIEARHGVTTGISTADRARTIAAASAPGASAADIVMPGHVFPLQVCGGGVLAKPCVPEAAVDLVKMAGGDSAAICMVLDDAGEIAGHEALTAVANEFDIPMVSVSEVVEYRLREELVVERVAEREIEVGVGRVFRAIVYRNDIDGHEHMALVAGDLSGPKPVPVRVHSQCLTGDVLGSRRCDCGDQLELALERIAAEKRGAIIYMHQEGRGIGLANKIRAYELQDCGRDTVEANLDLGFGEDLRDYAITSQIIKDLGIASVRLLTNNPQKVTGLERYGILIAERDSIEASPHEENIGYLRTKKAKLGHLLDEERLSAGTRDADNGSKR